MEKLKNLNNLSEVTKFEVENTVLNIEINISKESENSNIELNIVEEKEILNVYKGKSIDKLKYRFEVNLKDFIVGSTSRYEAILTINGIESNLVLNQTIIIEKIIVEDNEFLRKIHIKFKNGKITIKPKIEAKLQPEIKSISFDEELHVKGRFKRDIEILDYSNIEIKFRLFNKYSGKEIDKDIKVNKEKFSFKLSQEEIFKMNSLSNRKWDFYIDIFKDKEIISTENFKIKDSKKRILIEEELSYNDYDLKTDIYLNKRGSLSLKFDNPIGIKKVLRAILKKNETILRIRTKKDIVDIFNNFNISIVSNGTEYKNIKLKRNGKKTFTAILNVSKEVGRDIVENGFLVKEIIGDKTYLEEVKEIDKDMIMSNLKERVIKSKKYKNFLRDTYKSILTKLPVRKKKIVFESFLGRNCSGNPKYIYEYIVNSGLEKKYKVIWFFNNTDEEIIGSAKKVERRSFKYYYHLATAKYVVFNTRQLPFFIKREKQVYLQTWHGTPLKKLGMDMDSVDMGGLKDIDKYKDMFYKNTRRWDLLIAQNTYSENIFKSAFAFDKEILSYGYPANDILYTKNNIEDINKVKDKLNIPKDKKVILYAPTWRDNSFIKKGYYKMEIKLELEKMQKLLGEEYIILLRMHYLIMNSINIENFKGFAYDFSEGFDIQELYLVSDLLITDYSSVMFDYSNLNRDIIFFAYDIEEYRDSLRGFYFDFENEAPGPIVKTTDEVINNIINLSNVREEYKEKKDEFYNKFCNIDDGSASEKIVKRLLEI